MKIELSLGPNRAYEAIEVESGTELRDIYDEYRGGLEYDAYVAVVDNDVKPMTYRVHHDCRVQFLDIRAKSAFLVYQNSLIMLLLKAAVDVLDDKTLEVRMSLADGVYCAFPNREASKEDVSRLEAYMRELVADDLPITNQDFNYSIKGYSSRFYNYMVPSTGWLKHFELMQYRGGMLLRYPQPDDPEAIPEYKDEPLMFKAFEEQEKWNRLLGVRYMSDINEKIGKGGARELVQLSEALHDQKIVEIANEIVRTGKRIILILGPSSSGKTTTAKRLAIQLKVNGLDSFYVSTDDYFVERSETPKDENGNYNFEGIDAIDIDLFTKNMNDLLEGKEVDVPVFNFIDGGKEFGKRITRLNGRQPIIIEGIHAFNPALTGGIPDEHKFKMYISPLTQINIDRHNRIPTTDTRIIRRMVRDSRSRNYDAVTTLKNWRAVHAGEIENIFPFSSDADVFFNTVHIYEAAVLKKHAVPLLESVPREAPEYAEAQRLLRFFEDVTEIEDESLVANDSILREFIGGSIYDK